MLNTKSCYALIIYILLGSHYSFSCDAKNLFIPYFNHPPHFIITNDEKSPKGHFAEYLETHILNGIGPKWEWKKYDSFERIWKELKECNLQLAFGLSIIENIKNHFLFSKKPIIEGGDVLAVKKSFKENIVSNSVPLNGLIIAHFQANKGYLPKILTGDNKHTLYQLSGNKSFQRSVKMLRASRVDAVFYPDGPTLYLMLKKHKMLKTHKVIELASPKRYGYIVIPKKLKKAKDLMKIINLKMKSAPLTYNQYLKKMLK